MAAAEEKAKEEHHKRVQDEAMALVAVSDLAEHE